MSEAFRLDMIAWLEACDPDGDYSDEATAAQGLRPITIADGIQIASAWAIDEVGGDMTAGVVPQSVRSFSELHDHVDANGYGGAFHWPCLASDRDEAYQCAFSAFWNEVQDEVDGWLRVGAPNPYA